MRCSSRRRRPRRRASSRASPRRASSPPNSSPLAPTSQMRRSRNHKRTTTRTSRSSIRTTLALSTRSSRSSATPSRRSGKRSTSLRTRWITGGWTRTTRRLRRRGSKRCASSSWKRSDSVRRVSSFTSSRGRRRSEPQSLLQRRQSLHHRRLTASQVQTTPSARACRYPLHRSSWSKPARRASLQLQSNLQPPHQVPTPSWIRRLMQTSSRPRISRGLTPRPTRTHTRVEASFLGWTNTETIQMSSARVAQIVQGAILLLCYLKRFFVRIDCIQTQHLVQIPVCLILIPFLVVG
mmetsp:Transcript_21942/g.46402  ORF Transcript_21942/g.46402 Transcript_21942/m.46402 type:complete len:294 (-) Transcript_21942:16-897(-)